jgi:hypothetical protein
MPDISPRLADEVAVPVSQEACADLYQQREQQRTDAARKLAARELTCGYIRLMLAVAFVWLGWAAFHHEVAPWLPALPVLAFLPLAQYHSGIARRRDAAQRAAAFYAAGQARVQDRWANAAFTQKEPRGPYATSLYASDLDLFGPASLFALLSTARTRIGEDTLAAWLLKPARVPEILRRQAAVAELRPRLNLREDAALAAPLPGKRQASPDAASRTHHDALIAWAEAPPRLASSWQWIRLASPLVALAAFTALVAWVAGHSALPLVLLVLLGIIVSAAHGKHLDAIFAEANQALADLDLLGDLLTRFEREPCASPLLQQLQQQMRPNQNQAASAAQALAQLRTIGVLIDSRDNILIRGLDRPLLYSVQLGWFAESWRRRHGTQVRHWLTAIAAFEALLSIANYSFEHPADPFPTLIQEQEEQEDQENSAANTASAISNSRSNRSVFFDAQALGHPLLPAARCVRNPIRLETGQPVLLISGSNMSGKSTFLRAVGLNCILAMAGAPVRAESLRMSPFAVGASILVNDSLAEGSSRFYAEIKRLRAVCDMALDETAPTLLFLLDEILEGTNSQDRQVGAAGILATLAKRGAIGIATTHDLALTIAEASPEAPAGRPAAAVRNMHLQDAVVDGKMSFDYTLREGVVTRSNGIELMRLVGLDV